MFETITHWEVWAKALGILSFGIFLGLILHYILFRIFEKIARHSKTTFDNSLLKHTRKPTRLIILFIIINFVLQLLDVGYRNTRIYKTLHCRVSYCFNRMVAC